MLFMTQASYSADSWKAQIGNPQNRFEQLRGMLEGAGCRLVSAYYAFGEYDDVLIYEAPDATTAAALLVAVAGGGAISKLHTTVLMTGDEGLEAIRRAKKVAYKAPGA